MFWFDPDSIEPHSEELEFESWPILTRLYVWRPKPEPKSILGMNWPRFYLGSIDPQSRELESGFWPRPTPTHGGGGLDQDPIPSSLVGAQ